MWLVLLQTRGDKLIGWHFFPGNMQTLAQHEEIVLRSLKHLNGSLAKKGMCFDLRRAARLQFIPDNGFCAPPAHAAFVSCNTLRI